MCYNSNEVIYYILLEMVEVTMLNIQKIIEHNSITVYFQVIISPIDILSLGIESFIRGIDTDTNEIIPPNILFEEANDQSLSQKF